MQVHFPVILRNGTGSTQSNVLPRRKGTRIRVVCYRKYADFTRILTHITARYHPKPFISSVIETKVRTEHFDPVRIRTCGY